ncbi:MULTISPECIES: D-alanyl-D-alanine carboxypeptidase family protein [Sporomusa]|jgi:D-alanyl-D-alanine carboxypeptidase (penicillin-binding protein 5/6)|uniref:serine-type D-Ala-D-Ala carboxypeptidase n=1 Tax=Sporomusa sphaeroides DSM 2875 TaxID=1337886 RepID=A0ABP2C652_9FIRM|nr:MULTISPECIES: D-alanyl-D-alanine carboxypeptidase family protein [Sporomusa]MCM0761403.1 D-alanyl-D-alanine carboxypeptidase [Sporomusa sphaeroides DSM 2875]OLS56586.1 D-alanyl-D-alanine carboxypeptidase DacB precursor [Sporomusa sphaeroides DSM 2875]CVK19046.1 D-alanyl-D-alanine carboxypeptidase DacB precursor [Sporomusa sphaeroides DSM 2875]
MTRIVLRCTALLTFFLWLAAGTAGAAPPTLSAQAAVLMDAKTGQVLYDRNMNKKLAPASTTKIMTAIIAIESGRLDETTRVSIHAASTPGSSLNLYPGQSITLRELLTGLLLRSGNDAAVAIAEHLAGSVDAFVAIMNQKAGSIGALHTHFRNPHGLSAPNHASTAFDLAWITRYALNNPTFAEIVGTKETNIEWLDRKGKSHDRNLRNTNKLLWMLEDADGVKTGTTNAAGPCLVSSATRNNQKLIAVVLHDHSRWFDSMMLLKHGFDTYDLYEYAEQGAVFASLPVDNGITGMVDALVAAPAALVVNAADYSAVTVEVDLPEKIKAPVYQGQKIGEIIFYVQDKAVKTVDLVAGNAVEERTVSKVLLRHWLDTVRRLSNWGLL